MQISRLLAAASLVVVSLAGPASSQEEVDIGPVGPSPYDVVRAWHKPFAKQGFAHGGNSGIWAESPDRILVAQRGETRLPIPIPEEYG